MGVDIQIECAGIRPGEKLHEELAYGDEIHRQTSHPRIYCLNSQQAAPELTSLLGYLAVLIEAAQHPAINGRLRPALFSAARENWDTYLNTVADMDLLKSYRQDIAQLPAA